MSAVTALSLSIVATADTPNVAIDRECAESRKGLVVINFEFSQQFRYALRGMSEFKVSAMCSVPKRLTCNTLTHESEQSIGSGHLP